MNPRIEQRDLASPWEWGRARPGMAWHHIIPFSLLRDVWNRLVDQHIASDIPEARVAIRQYLMLADRRLPDLDSLIDRMRLEDSSRKRAGHSRLEPLDVPDALQLATAAVWPAWNAVEGPARRSDDPQNRYFDRFTSGLTAQEELRMRWIETLFHNFQQFVSAGPAPDADGLRMLSQAISHARLVVPCERPISYRPEMWAQDGNGLWRKRRDGERYVPSP